MRQRVMHIVLNHFLPDYRVLKEAVALQRAGYQVTIYALWNEKLPRCEVIDGVTVRRMRLLTKGLPVALPFLFVRLVEWLVRLLWAAIRERVAVIHAHDLNGLLAGSIVAGITRRPLIYDSHELWSHTNAMRDYPLWFVQFARLGERIMARRANRVITVSGSIAETMATDMGIATPALVRNIPETPQGNAESTLRADLGIPADAVVLLYIGMIFPNRGVDLLLRAFIRLNDPRTHLVFLGTPELPAWLDVAIPPERAPQIHCYPRVHPRNVVALARGADLGVIAISGNITSYRMALPNKLFESIHAGLAMLVTDLPEMRGVVEQYGIGRTFRDGDEDDLVRQMQAMIADQAGLAAMQAATRAAAAELNWEIEQRTLLAVYAEVLRGED